MEVNNDTGRAALVIVLTILGVILINLAIFAMVRGKSTTGQIDLLRKVTKQARNPWEIEDNKLKDLSELVKQFKHDPNQDGLAPGSEKDKQGDKQDG